MIVTAITDATAAIGVTATEMADVIATTAKVVVDPRAAADA